MTIAFKPTASSTTIEQNGSAIATLDSTGLTMAAGKTIVGSGVGKVLQVLQAHKTDAFSTASSSFTDITGLSVSITPSSTSSKILITWKCAVAGNVNNHADLRLMRNATAIDVGGAAGNRTPTTAGNYSGSNFMMTAGGVYLDSPSSTSSTTYKLQLRTNTGNAIVRINSNYDYNDASSTPVTASSIIVMEVAA